MDIAPHPLDHRPQRKSAMADGMLWVLQTLAAVMMFASGAMTAFTPRDRLVEKMKWVATWRDDTVRLLGVAEMLGAAGLLLPGLVHVAVVLTPIAATCLAILMVGAVKTNLDIGGPRAPAIVGLVLCVAVAVGRFVIAPLS
jgi:uncharacterized membrane protein